MPVGDPAWRSTRRKNHGEQARRDAYCLQNDARVEIHIREQLALDEVVILESNFLQFLCDSQQRVILTAQLFKNLVADALITVALGS